MRNLEKRGLLEQTLEKTGLLDHVEIEQLDVTSGASIAGAVKSILARTGNKLDAVVHNVGVAAAGALEDVPESELRRGMETNFFGVLELTRALLPTSGYRGADGSLSFLVKPPSWDSPQMRFIALQNGRSKAGPRLPPTSLSRWASRLCL